MMARNAGTFEFHDILCNMAYEKITHFKDHTSPSFSLLNSEN